MDELRPILTDRLAISRLWGALSFAEVDLLVPLTWGVIKRLPAKPKSGPHNVMLAIRYCYPAGGQLDLRLALQIARDAYPSRNTSVLDRERKTTPHGATGGKGYQIPIAYSDLEGIRICYHLIPQTRSVVPVRWRPRVRHLRPSQGRMHT